MNARASILSPLRSVTLPRVELPIDEMPTVAPDQADLVRRFADAARAASAEVVEDDRASLASFVERMALPGALIMSAVAGVADTVPHDAVVDTLARLQLFVCEAVLGVAENGAVWLPRSRLGARAAVFLAEEVIVAVDRSTLVLDLHHAYRRINAAAEPFGVFIAGPSKTADIEQSLVIGAHGPKRLTIVLR